MSASFSVLSVESAALTGGFSARDLQRRRDVLLPSVVLFSPNLPNRLYPVILFVITKRTVQSTIPSGRVLKIDLHLPRFLRTKNVLKSPVESLFDSREVGESYVQVARPAGSLRPRLPVDSEAVQAGVFWVTPVGQHAHLDDLESLVVPLLCVKHIFLHLEHGIRPVPHVSA